MTFLTGVVGAVTTEHLTTALATLEVRAAQARQASAARGEAITRQNQARAIAAIFDQAYRAMQVVPRAADWRVPVERLDALGDLRKDPTISTAVSNLKEGVDAALSLVARCEQAAAALVVPEAEERGPEKMVDLLRKLLRGKPEQSHVGPALADALSKWRTTKIIQNVMRSDPTLTSSLDQADVTQLRSELLDVLDELCTRAERVFKNQLRIGDVLDESPLLTHPLNSHIAQLYLADALDGMADILSVSGSLPAGKAYDKNLNPLLNYLIDKRREQAITGLGRLAGQVRCQGPELAQSMLAFAETITFGFGEVETLANLLEFLARLVTEYGPEVRAQREAASAATHA